MKSGALKASIVVVFIAAMSGNTQAQLNVPDKAKLRQPCRAELYGCLIALNVTVSNKKSKPVVTNLSAADFSVYVDGNLIEIDFFTQPGAFTDKADPYVLGFFPKGSELGRRHSLRVKLTSRTSYTLKLSDVPRKFVF